MKAQELDQFRDTLLRLRERVGGEVNHVAAAIQEDIQVPGHISGAPVHLADAAMDTVDADVEVLNATTAILTDVNAALDRIAAGTFGRCEACDEPIAAERLQAIPYTPHCVACARAFSDDRGAA